MYIRMLVGGRAGEIMDVEPVSARSLLACGSALDPYAPSEPAEETHTDQAPTPAKHVAKKRKQAK